MTPRELGALHAIETGLPLTSTQVAAAARILATVEDVAA